MTSDLSNQFDDITQQHHNPSNKPKCSKKNLLVRNFLLFIYTCKKSFGFFDRFLYFNQNHISVAILCSSSISVDYGTEHLINYVKSIKCKMNPNEAFQFVCMVWIGTIERKSDNTSTTVTPHKLKQLIFSWIETDTTALCLNLLCVYSFTFATRY